MCGHQLPFLSCLIPLYMVKTMCTWRQTLAIWPALLVGGGSFAVFQFFFATAHAYGLPPIWPLTDICGAIFSMVTPRAVPQVRLEAEGRVEVPGRSGRRRADRPKPPAAERPAGRSRRRRKSRRCCRAGQGMADANAADRRARDPGVVAVGHHGRVPGRLRHG